MTTTVDTPARTSGRGWASWWARVTSRSWFGFVVRLLRMATTLWAISLATFGMTALLKGDAAETILGQTADPQALDALRAELHLDDPFWQRYFTWLGNAVQGDFGLSYTQAEPVSTLIGRALPVTLELIVLSMIVSLALAIPLGVLTAARPNNVFSRMVRVGSYALLSVPPFVIGVALVVVFALQRQLFPPAGWVPFSTDPLENLRFAALPVATLALAQVAILTQVLRGDMTSTLDQDFVSFADSKGLPARRVLFVHAFRPASFSLFTLAGAQFGYLVGGTVIVEVLFNLPGLGTAMTTAIAQRDLVTVQGITLFMAAAFVIVNFVVDSLYALIDPRLRIRHAAH